MEPIVPEIMDSTTAIAVVAEMGKIPKVATNKVAVIGETEDVAVFAVKLGLTARATRKSDVSRAKDAIYDRFVTNGRKHGLPCRKILDAVEAAPKVWLVKASRMW